MDTWIKNDISVKVLYSVGAVATQVFISSKNASILVDAGDGTLRDLLSIGFEPDGLDAILITHGHFDHIGSLHALLGYIKMKSKSRILPVFLPNGCTQATEMLEGFARLYSDRMPFVLDIAHLDDGDEFAVKDLKVICASVIHHSLEPNGSSFPMPALGYRITDGKTTVAVSGDCGDSQSVRDLVRDADLALVEANFKSYTSEIQKKMHLTESLAEEIGGLAREHILIHRRP